MVVENAGIQPAICKEYPPELRQEPGLTESTASFNVNSLTFQVLISHFSKIQGSEFLY